MKFFVKANPILWAKTHLVAMSLLLAGLGGASVFGPHLVNSQDAPVPAASVSTKDNTNGQTSPGLLSASMPTRLNINKISVNAPVVPLGLEKDGSLATPNSAVTAGWYRNSPTPGELGPSVIVGHVDYVNYGPAVFWDLSKLTPGDTFEVERKDGTKAKFKVDSVEAYPQANFPTEKVYGNINHAGIRLITCGGAWNEQTHHYSENTVVFGSLAVN
jgi:sortase (surface protein transpeptidase)